MANISNLTSKILKDAEDKKDSIILAAEEEKAKIISKKEKEAKSLEATMIEKAEREAQTRKERIISGAELTARNEKLKAKQAIIKEVFDTSVSELCALGNKEFQAFVKDTILALDINEEEDLILNEAGMKIIDDAFVSEINKELANKGLKGKITLSNQAGDFKGGFILENNGIQINNTFEALVDSVKVEMEYEVAKELFN